MTDPVERRRDDDVPPLHPLEVPLVWFGVQLVELVIVEAVLLALIPDHWPNGILLAISVPILVGLTVLNYAIRRRFIPH